MIRFLVLTGLLAGLIAAPAAVAESSPVDGAFGNTIVSTYPDARTGELWLAPGGAYTAKGRRGDPSRGHWSVRGSKLCLKQAAPFPMLFSFCTPIPSSGLGETWAAKAATGESIRVQLVKGHYAGGGRSAGGS